MSGFPQPRPGGAIRAAAVAPGFRAALLLPILLAGPPLRASAANEEPKQLGLKESVSIDLVQLEVTVWPKTPGSDACLGLTADDFELLVDGTPRPIYAVDAIGSEEEVYAPDAPPAIHPAAGGMALVLFFDLWHLDVFYRAYDACPQTKPFAFEEARRLVREEFRPGERAYACRAAEGTATSYTGQLVPLAGGPGVPLTLRWLDPPRHPNDGCGWLIGAIPASLSSGLWTFEPPAELGGAGSAPAVEFSVVSSAPPAALPAEVAPE